MTDTVVETHLADPRVPEQERHLDVIVVGAGLSGIGAGYRLAEMRPEKSWAILEARSTLGGTWDLFRYPGVRSDSDMYTLGFPFRPWNDPRAIADGGSILRYLKETAQESGVDKRIHYNRRVTRAEFSSETARWTLTVEVNDPDARGEDATSGALVETWTCNFLYGCAGYYSYEHGHAPTWPGMENYRGTVVHPQFWPEDLDYTGKKVVVIGSGATAVTVVPAMARDAEHVTMLQRSPTYLLTRPARNGFDNALRRIVPGKPGYWLARTKNMAAGLALYEVSRRRPDTVRKLINADLRMRLGKDREQDIQEHFQPRYDPWDQRLCVVPDADFFAAMRAGKASIVTDHIETFTEHGIRTRSGKEIEADIVVTATGLSLQLLGGMELLVDGERVDLSERYSYRGLMISGLPNAAACVGYLNASWTMRADLSSQYVCKLLGHMDSVGAQIAYPTPPAAQEERPLLDMDSGYLQRAAAAFPKQGEGAPWTMPQNYLKDVRQMKLGRIDEQMTFTKAGLPVPKGASTASASTAGASNAAAPSV